ncbi:hypothetical protein [Streptomyces sp. NPDC058657]|uniref:hypothetical protein n=1 Tax=unclassified Streptomyces TaxID=2593676 RepID=UPI003651DBFB
MSSTGTLLRLTADTITDFGLERDQLANPATGALSLEAAVYRAVTGTTPNAFTDPTATQYADVLITTNTTVMEVIAWISVVLPTEPPGDSASGGDDHLEHLRTWTTENDFFTGVLPTPAEVTGILLRAAQTADNLTDVPTPRPAAA